MSEKCFYITDPLLPWQMALPHALVVECPSAPSCPIQGYGPCISLDTVRTLELGGEDTEEDWVSKCYFLCPLDLNEHSTLAVWAYGKVMLKENVV